MSKSTFDATAFLTTTVRAKFDDSMTPVPEGDWQFQVQDVIANLFSTKNGDKVVVDLDCLCLSPEVAEEMGLDEPKCRYKLWIDQDENGALSTGPNKNVNLGRMREIGGQNDASADWTFTNLIGINFTGKVEQSMNDNDVIYSNIVRVTDPE